MLGINDIAKYCCVDICGVSAGVTAAGRGNRHRCHSHHGRPVRPCLAIPYTLATGGLLRWNSRKNIEFLGPSSPFEYLVAIDCEEWLPSARTFRLGWFAG